MCTLLTDSRMKKFPKWMKEEENWKVKHFFMGLLMYDRVIWRPWLYEILNIIWYFFMFADDFTASEHTHICIMNCEMTKICIDNKIQNEVSDCLRIKTYVIKNVPLRSDWFGVLLIMPLFATVSKQRADKGNPSLWRFYVFFKSRKSNPFSLSFTSNDLSSL